jgi:hypothetical protein
MERNMAMILNKSFATAILSGALVLGGLSAAVAHHGDVSGHSTTKGKSLGEIEKLERQITADLNRKSATGALQVAQNQTTGSGQMNQLIGGAQGDVLMPMPELSSSTIESDDTQVDAASAEEMEGQD